ncbi:MAG TPA: hypothetical protein VMZ31_17685 [Phycisphaerae bacterium]|nr:hypothetical protein [Phycisphaerae bacterium]
MGLVNGTSLAGTLCNIREVLLRGEKIPKPEREQAAAWIASRAGAPGSYRGLPAPTTRDYSTKLRLFTGETVGSQAGTGCKLGFEATWAITVLRPTKTAVARVAETCRQRALERFSQETARQRGMYCCYSCSNAGWQALGVTPGGDADELLEAGLSLLRSLRRSTGRWDKFPFWYTVLALSDMDRPSALAELRHAAPALQRAMKARPKPDAATQRRLSLARHVLNRV